MATQEDEKALMELQERMLGNTQTLYKVCARDHSPEATITHHAVGCG
jgi:hypothetical protein